MASFQILDPREEEELHRSRLLNVEEKPFKRLTKRLLTPGSLISNPGKLLTPPPENSSDEASSQDAERQKQLDDLRQFREDIIFDFEAFDSSIARIQFLRNSNERERERYQADKERILDTAQEVRESTAKLRIKLDEAKKQLEQRKQFDKLSDKIYTNIMLKPRTEQEVNIKKLEEECRELERESLQYAETWKERRAQFNKIVEEGMQLRRLIRDEKEEVERREGMAEGEEDGEVGEGSRGGQTPKHISGNATPGPEGASQDTGLKPKPFTTGTLSRPGSRTTSRAPSPAPSERSRMGHEEAASEMGGKLEEGDIAVADTPMADNIEPETPQVIVDEPVDEAVEEEGKSVEEGEAEENMDTT